MDPLRSVMAVPWEWVAIPAFAVAALFVAVELSSDDEALPPAYEWQYTAGEIETLFREFGCPGRPEQTTFARAERSESPGVWLVSSGPWRFTVREETLVFVPATDGLGRLCAPP